MPQPQRPHPSCPRHQLRQGKAFAFERRGPRAKRCTSTASWRTRRLVERFQILCLPGGFSYGDDVAAGRILANQIEHHLADALAQFKADGKLVLGICNGFQVMIKSGILLAAGRRQGPPATLTLNDSGKYEDRWVRLRVDGQKCVFLAGIETMYLPVAHGEGKFITRDAAALEQLGSRPGNWCCVMSVASARRGTGGPLAVSGQSQRLDGRRGRAVRRQRPGPGPDAASRAAHRPHATSPLDPRPGRPGRRRLAVFLNAVGYFR